MTGITGMITEGPSHVSLIASDALVLSHVGEEFVCTGSTSPSRSASELIPGSKTHVIVKVNSEQVRTQYKNLRFNNLQNIKTKSCSSNNFLKSE